MSKLDLLSEQFEYEQTKTQRRYSKVDSVVVCSIPTNEWCFAYLSKFLSAYCQLIVSLLSACCQIGINTDS